MDSKLGNTKAEEREQAKCTEEVYPNGEACLRGKTLREEIQRLV